MPLIYLVRGNFYLLNHCIKSNQTNVYRNEIRNYEQKGAIMKTCTQSSAWINRIVIVFSSIVVGSLVDIITMTMTGRPIPGIIAALGLMALAGLVRLLISPLNQGLSR